MIDIRKGTCPACGNNRIIEANPPEFTSSVEVYFAATYDPKRNSFSRNPNKPRGAFLAYICKRCGFTQWYCEDPGDIPLDDGYRTRLIEGPEPQGPYR
jgi:predicted nucleic-acid-binding Zn-ribbon protein